MRWSSSRRLLLVYAYTEIRKANTHTHISGAKFAYKTHVYGAAF